MMDLKNIACELDTSELHLRRIALSDAEAMFAMLSDAESMKYWSSPPVSDVSDALEILQKDIESDARGDSICWAVTLRDEDEMIGKCILFQFSPANRRAEIGFILNRDYWRRGLMHQALEAVIHFAFNTLKLHRIEADVDPDNAGSLGILDKLGFEREGLFRDRWQLNDGWVDSVMLGLLNRD
ncbi:MAG: GNAT family N-acetyltransferase [Xanthomonadales bacterium]|nr:GNAT family N-acetyltransferase [Xanthomonadales bacterium]